MIQVGWHSTGKVRTTEGTVLSGVKEGAPQKLELVGRTVNGAPDPHGLVSPFGLVDRLLEGDQLAVPSGANAYNAMGIDGVPLPLEANAPYVVVVQFYKIAVPSSEPELAPVSVRKV
ncbi:MAG: hypothetical protein Q7S65_05120 [Nanoarchaeota archaeon]|nr:hypothetical protein [Nanoarchaeota archaeon]